MSPEWFPDPVSYFCLLFHVVGMETVGKHYTATAHRLAGFLQHYGIRFRSGEHYPDDFTTVFHQVCGAQPAIGPMSGSLAYLYMISASVSFQGLRMSLSVSTVVIMLSFPFPSFIIYISMTTKILSRKKISSRIIMGISSPSKSHQWIC